jgi:peptide/nickel transport system substrate-binding protein
VPAKTSFAAVAAAAGLALAGVVSVSTQASAQNRNIVVVLEEEPDNLDSCNTTRSNIGRVVKVNIIESLTMLDPATASLTPRLATSWERVSDRSGTSSCARA